MATVYWPGTTTYPGTTQYPGQAINPFHILEVSFDDISVKAPTWTNVSTRLLSWRTGGGRASELEEMDARTASYVLDDRDRQLDPTHTGSTYYPNVVPNRRIRHRVQIASSSTTFDVFAGYIDRWGPTWPEGQEWSNAEVHIEATDGSKILANYHLPAANPDVDEYSEVLDASDPTLYYRLGDPRGTRLVPHKRRIRWKKVKKGKRKGEWRYKTKRWKTRETRAAVEGDAGSAGSYKNTPALGQPGAIAGDEDTAVAFRESQNEYAKVVLEQTASLSGGGSVTGASDLTDRNRLTMACWIKVTSVRGARQAILAGPGLSGGGSPVFYLHITPTDRWGSWLLFKDATLSQATGPAVSEQLWHHVAATWDGTVHRLYLDGAQVASDTPAAGKEVRPGGTLTDDKPFFQIGRTTESGLTESLNATVDEVVFYERALSAARIQAHYDAAFLGFAASSTGVRISNILAFVDEWQEWRISAGTRTMPKARYAGFGAADLVEEAVDCEATNAIFFFDKKGRPTFLPENYRSFAPYNASLYTFGNGGGETPYEGLNVDDADAFLYNDVRISRDVGDGEDDDGETATATDATSISRFGRRTYSDEAPSTSTTDINAIAAAFLARYKDPMIRLSQFELNSLDTSAAAALLTLDLGDSVRVKFQPVGGGSPLDQTSYVERVELSQAEKGAPIMGTFGISPR